MKRTFEYPRPYKAVINGDSDDSVAAPVSHRTNQRPTRSIAEAAKLGQLWWKNGLGPRSIVSLKWMSHGAGTPQDWSEPENWGIVVDVRILDPWPFIVRWADGSRFKHEADELVVVYPCRTKDSFLDDFKTRNPAL